MTKKPASEEKIAEETLAASSLHPAARAVTDDPKSKIDYMTRAIGAMHAMRKDDLVKWYNDSVAQIGHEADLVGDNSEHNKSSINMKPSAAEGHPGDHGEKMGTPKLSGGGQPASEAGKTEPEKRMPMPKISVKEDVEEMFIGQDLSEEFKTNAVTLFEAAINARIILETARLEEEFDKMFNEAVDGVATDLTDKVDSYLNYAVENWMKDNTVALESVIRNELMEDFIGGLRTLFTEHNISIPEEQVDAVTALSEKVEELEKRLNDVITENNDMKNTIAESVVNEAFVEISTGLADSQREKFQSLAEGVEFDGDLDGFKKKLGVIKEQYFGSAKKPPGKTNIEEETFEIPAKEESSGYAEVDHFIRAMDRTIRK